MSARSNGMMAYAKPGTLNDALDKVMLPEDDPASPIPAGEGKSPVEGSAPEVKPVSVRRSKPDKEADAGILAELSSFQRTKRVKVQLNTRIDDWVDRGINKALRDLQEAGLTGVTKEAIVIQSIVRGLKLTPPEGWEPL